MYEVISYWKNSWVLWHLARDVGSGSFGPQGLFSVFDTFDTPLKFDLRCLEAKPIIFMLPQSHCCLIFEVLKDALSCRGCEGLWDVLGLQGKGHDHVNSRTQIRPAGPFWWHDLVEEIGCAPENVTPYFNKRTFPITVGNTYNLIFSFHCLWPIVWTVLKFD